MNANERLKAQVQHAIFELEAAMELSYAKQRALQKDIATLLDFKRVSGF